MAKMPKWLTDQRGDQNRRSARQEKERAAEIGGKRQAGSGSSHRAPQDVVSPDYMEQLKYTDQKSFALKQAEWLRLKADAQRAGKVPRMVIDFPGTKLIITEE